MPFGSPDFPRSCPAPLSRVLASLLSRTMALSGTVFFLSSTPPPPIVRPSRESPEELPGQQAHKILSLTVFWRTRLGQQGGQY